MNTRISKDFGNYSSCKYKGYDSIKRISKYVAVRDGTKLAIDM